MKEILCIQIKLESGSFCGRCVCYVCLLGFVNHLCSETFSNNLKISEGKVILWHALNAKDFYTHLVDKVLRSLNHNCISKVWNNQYIIIQIYTHSDPKISTYTTDMELSIIHKLRCIYFKVFFFFYFKNKFSIHYCLQWNVQ